ncbi:hypothetical protein LC085_12005 [Bacillus tianshenii]|uniref:hypothetical protein n=1 Tax=Sutcliffiella tianshenii TaxID=1463404 RepID=UPI001CD24C75|nr:hypothetical protein [Bacillus tianshenii]MCA1320636.1 hypothetical protein [Bacillus tianshenii]
MSLNKVTLREVVKKQYLHKLKAYSGVYTSLMVIQAIALLFAFNAMSSFGTSSEAFSLDIKYYSVDVVIGLTMLWAFITSITVTLKGYRNFDFNLVTNRLSSDLSNFAFLGTVGLIGTITSLLSSFLIKVILYVMPSTEVMYFSNMQTSPAIIIKGAIAAFLYMILFAALGYLVGTLVQLHPLVKVVLPVVFFGLLLFGGIMGRVDIVASVFGFYFTEASFLLFLVKVLITVASLLYVSAMINDRTEVRT